MLITCFVPFPPVAPLIASPEESGLTVVSGTPLSLPCTVVMGHPTPTLRWFFEDRAITPDEGKLVYSGRSSVSVK